MAADRWIDAARENGLHEAVDEMVFIGVDPTFDPAALLTPTLRRLVVVDAQPDIVEALRPLSRTDDRIVVVDASLAEATGAATLFVSNYSVLSSVRAMLHPSEVFPNARTIETLEVRALSVLDLLDTLGVGDGVEDPTERLLAIAAPGITHMAVEALRADDRLKLFEHILLRGPRRPMHDGDAPVSRTIALLHEEGYRIVSTIDDDPVHPRVFMRRDPLTIDVARLSAALDAAEARAADLAATLTQAGAEAAAHAQAADRALAEAQAEAAGHAAKLAQTETALDQAHARIAQLEQVLDGTERHSRRIDEEIQRAETQLELLRQIVTGATHAR